MDMLLKMQVQLKENRLLRTSDEIDKFEEAIANILEAQNVDHIEVLCSGFDDLTEQHEVMWGLIHAVESYYKIVDPEEYLEKFAKSIPQMLPHANEWLETLHIRILNDDSSRVMYGKIIKKLDAGIQEVIVSQLKKIRDEDPETM